MTTDQADAEAAADIFQSYQRHDNRRRALEHAVALTEQRRRPSRRRTVRLAAALEAYLNGDGDA